MNECIGQRKDDRIDKVYMLSLHRGHANLLCVIQIFIDVLPK